MSLFTVARIAAIVVAVPLAGALIVNSEYRADNIFAVPDLLGCAVLLAAVVPSRYGTAMFTVGFGWMAGVITTAAFDRLDGGETGNAVLNFTIAAGYAVLAALFARRVAPATADPAAADRAEVLHSR